MRFVDALKLSLWEEVALLPTPSQITLGKGRFRIDVARMKFMADVHRDVAQSGAILFSLADSSQIRQGNVLMNEYYYVQGSGDLVQAFQCLMALQHLSHSVEDCLSRERKM